MSAIVETIDRELGAARVDLAAAELRVTRLEELREKASELEGGGMVEAPVAPPKPRRRGKRRADAAAGVDARRPPRIAASHAGEAQAAILAHLAEHGPSTVESIAEGTGLSTRTVRPRLAPLASERKIHVDGAGVRGAPRTYALATAEATKPDENGARTETERKVVEAVSSVELTATEISFNTGIPAGQAVAVAEGLARRGVLVRENANGKALYGVPG